MQAALVTTLVFCFILLMVGLATAAFWRGRRRRGVWMIAAALLLSIASGVGLVVLADWEAQQAGYADYLDQLHASSAGYNDPTAWQEVREQFVAERSAAARTRADAEAAAKLVEGTAEETQCRKDLICLGEKQLVWAGVMCPPEIEKLATYGTNWTDNWMELKFSRYLWLDKERGTLTMVGDALEFENGFGAKANMIYECDIDPVAELILAVRAFPGRL